MASIYQIASGRWQARIRRKGLPSVSKNFLSKAAAESWVRGKEREIEEGVFIPLAESRRTLLSTVLEDYLEQVLPRLKGKKQEESRVRVVGRVLGGETLANLTPSLLSEYRNTRLTEVCPKTVREELSLLQRVMNFAIKDRGMVLPNGNPLNHVRKPTQHVARDRRLTDYEWTVVQQTPVFAFAVHTAMRRGEIANLKWTDLSLSQRWLKVRVAKSGKPRTIPLTLEAVRLLREQQEMLQEQHDTNGNCLWQRPVNTNGTLPVSSKEGDGGAMFVFPYSPDSITVKFRRMCKQYGFQDLRFHDLRHEATSRLFERGLSLMEVASITGHASLQMLNVYTHLSQNHLLSKLDA